MEGTRDSRSYPDRRGVAAELGIERRNSHDGPDGHLRLQHPALRILAGNADVGGDYEFGPSASVGHNFRIASLICRVLRLCHTRAGIFSNLAALETAAGA